jgi:Mn2+/Fe2+ NRAMP family transporter
VNPVKALFWTAVVNGQLAPIILACILLLARHLNLMKDQPSSMLSRVSVGVTMLAMFAAAIALFLV